MIEVKANWVPVSQLGQFLANSGSPVDPRLYHVNSTTENGQQVQYALVSFHIISKMVPNWTWATFEHMNNPGRCDVLGCYDIFGSTPPSMAPHTPDNAGKQYPNCTKSPALSALFAAGKIDPAFTNYCLKGTQIDFTDAQGVVTRLGNSVTEQGFLDSASCITCHGRAAYSFVSGGWSANWVFTFNSTPIGPTGPLDPGQFWLYPEKDPMRPQDAAIFRPARLRLVAAVLRPRCCRQVELRREIALLSCRLMSSCREAIAISAGANRSRRLRVMHRSRSGFI